MSLPWFIGLRFSISAKGSRFLSFITGVSMIGLALGVMALTIVVSVMNGFDSQLKSRILGAVPHMVVKQGGPLALQDIRHPGIESKARFLQREGMVMHAGKNYMVAVYGIDPDKEPAMSAIPQHMRQGRVDDLVAGQQGIIIGAPLARRLGLWPGDALSLLIPEPSKNGSRVVPRFANVILTGTFEMESEVDYGLVIIHVSDLQSILRLPQADIRLKLTDVLQTAEIRGALLQASRQAARHGSTPALEIDDWSRQWGDFFATVRLEKIMMFILLTLIVTIAAFNTVSGLNMMVKEKQAEIAILRTLGLSRYSVMGIFVVQGTLIGVVGIILGLVLGLPIAFYITEVVGFFEDIMGTRILSGTYFDRVPSDVRLFDIALIIAVSIFISMTATLYPAYQAAKINPAETLKAD